MKKTDGIQLLVNAFMRCLSVMCNTAGNMQNEINAVVTNGKQKARLLKKLDAEMKALAEAYKAAAESTPPLADAYKKEIKRCEPLLKFARINGKNTAHYTDAQVTQAFTEYKRRNPKETAAWAAAEALIREGQPLDKWHHVNSAWKRIGRMAEKGMGITREEWYNGL